MDTPQETASQLALSSYTRAFLKRYLAIKPKPWPDELSRIHVSQTVSFFALAYERVRNVVEYREAHLIRRAATERILKRRLALNPSGEGEAENIVRELLWARYFPLDSLGEEDIDRVQDVLDRYKALRQDLLKGRPGGERAYLSQFLTDLLTCEIEETLTPEEAARGELETYFVYQVLKGKIKIDGATQDEKNVYFYVALEQALSKSDTAYLRFHLFRLNHKPLSQMEEAQVADLLDEFPEAARRIDSYIANPYSSRLVRWLRRQLPPFRVLFELVRTKPAQAQALLEDPAALKAQVTTICRQKYEATAARLRSLGVRAILYIFITKMIFALLLEYPVSKALYGEVNYLSLAINALFPPLLMFLILGVTRVPGEDNTARILERLTNIIDADNSYEGAVSYAIRRRRVRNQTMIFAFTIIYTMTFIMTFTLLYVFLGKLQFNFVSQVVFIFFVSLVTFFAFRISQVAREYRLREAEGPLVPVMDFFFLPILSLGKFLSKGLARLNIFTAVFDFFIEAPFKLIFEVLEEWISFVRARKEEIE